MKKLLLLSTLMVSGWIAAKAQTYVAMPTTDTRWSELYRAHIDSTSKMRYFELLNGDTIINSVSYHKLYYSRDTVFDAGEYIGGIREEDKKVYYIGDYGWFAPTDEALLYDFSVQLGDTLFANANNGNNNWRIDMIVSNVDSIMINGSYRRQIHLDPTFMPAAPYYTRWVDGIGNLVRGLLFSSGTFPNNGMWNELICQHQDNQLLWHHIQGWLYPTVPFPTCNVIIENVPDIYKGANSSPVVPNPVTGTSYIYLDGGAGFETLVIYNILGRKVLTRDVRNLEKIAINGGDMHKGVYNYIITSKSGQRVSGKFLVQ